MYFCSVYFVICVFSIYRKIYFIILKMTVIISMTFKSNIADFSLMMAEINLCKWTSMCAPINSWLINSWHAYKTSQTLHVKNIFFQFNMQSDISVIASFSLYTLIILSIISILFYLFLNYFSFQKVQCPLCKKFILDLPRHMRGKQHGWSKSKGKYVKMIFNIRRRRANSATSDVKIQEEYKYCTYPDVTASGSGGLIKVSNFTYLGMFVEEHGPSSEGKQQLSHAVCESVFLSNYYE